MSEPVSELVDLCKLNGDFKRNYGKLIGAFLFLRAVSAARGRRVLWSSIFAAIIFAGTMWLERHAGLRPHVPL
jgi:hypothetical protein